MDDIFIRDETLDINSTTHYHLSIRLGPDGLSFCILDLDYNKYIQLQHVAFKERIPLIDDFSKKVTETLDKNELYKKQYKSVFFMGISPRVTVLPTCFSEKENIKNIYEFNQELEELEELHVNDISAGETSLSVIFTLHNYIASDLVKTYPKIKFFNQSTPFILNGIEKSKKDVGKNKIYVNVHPDFFDIAVIKSGKLALYNNFSFHDDNEFVYYILNVYKQLFLDPLRDELILSGDIKKGSVSLKIINQYLANTRFDKPNDSFTYSYTFGSLPTHCFVNFFNLYNCV